jgi:hypothetical protein
MFDFSENCGVINLGTPQAQRPDLDHQVWLPFSRAAPFHASAGMNVPASKCRITLASEGHTKL